MDKAYNDKMVSLFTLLEEYKYLMANTKCEAMRNYFMERFQDNCKKVEVLLRQGPVSEDYTYRAENKSVDMVNYVQRQEKEYTVEELTKYNGRRGMPAYVAVNGVVYDLSNIASWGGGTHFGLVAGENLTSEYMSCHGGMDVLSKLPRVGRIRG